MTSPWLQKAILAAKDASLLHSQADVNFNAEPQPNFFKTNPDEEQEKNIIRILLEWGNLKMSNEKLVAEMLFDEIELSLIDNPICAKIFCANLISFYLFDVDAVTRHAELFSSMQ